MNCKFSKDKILEVSKKEFLKYGYQGVSLRKIAKKCKLSTGAIYGNFKNKEELFNEIIHKDLKNILNVFKIAKTKTIACNDKVIEILKKGEITQELLDEAENMYKYMYANREAFILIYSSIGTKYEKIITDFTEEDIKSTFELYKKVKGISKIEKHKERILRTIAGDCFKGMIPYLIEFKTYEEAKEYLELYIKYYISSFLFLVNI